MNSKALVLFSGGQDSTTCLAWALERYASVETIGFDYGQRHSVELECRLTVMQEIRKSFPAWSERLGMDHMLDLKFLGQISDTALTESKAIEVQKFVDRLTTQPGQDVIASCKIGSE